MQADAPVRIELAAAPSLGHPTASARVLLNVVVAGGDLRLCAPRHTLFLLLAEMALLYLLTCLFSQGYFGKECFIKLAPFAVVIGVGLVTGN